MNTKQIQKYVMDYLESTSCQILEKSPTRVTVKLSPEADKALTNRSYYWSFVDRTGADPETMTFTFVFDEPTDLTSPSNVALKSSSKVHDPGSRPISAPGSNGILERYFGFVPTSAQGKSIEEKLTYGSSRLQQIFQSVKNHGQYVFLYENPMNNHRHSLQTTELSSWLGLNYKVEFTCDMKRDELHSLGISLSTGEITEHFHDDVLTRDLSPKLPQYAHIKETISLERAKVELEKYLMNKLLSYDHSWALKAKERMQVELERMESYYQDLIQSAEKDQKHEITDQYQNRLEEIEWQYQPNITVSVINCGIFHLTKESFRQLNKT